jgi:hypothetical protein
VVPPVPANEEPSVFVENANLSISSSTPFLHFQVNQTPGSVLIVRLGISLEDWQEATESNLTLQNLRWGGNTGNTVWIKYLDYPQGKIGDLEVIDGVGSPLSITENWVGYLQEELRYPIHTLTGIQFIVGFPSAKNATLSITDLSFQDSSILATNHSDSGETFVTDYDSFGQVYQRGLLPERINLEFSIDSPSAVPYSTVVVWKDLAGNLHTYRNGFLLSSAPGNESVWVDLWAPIQGLKYSIDPLSLAASNLSDGQFAILFVPSSSLPPSGLAFHLDTLNIFFSTPSMPQNPQSYSEGGGITFLTDETLVVLLLLSVPLVVLVAFIVRARGRWSLNPRKIALLVAAGLVIRFVLVPITNQPVDTKQFCDAGSLFFSHGTVFDMWVDFPFYYYALLVASIPYGLLSALGFSGQQFLALSCNSVQMIGVKSVDVFSDVAAYLFLCGIVGARRDRIGKFAPELYFFNPVTILASAVWAHLNSLYIMLMIAGLYFMTKPAVYRPIIAFSLAAMTIPVGFASVLAYLLGLLKTQVRTFVIATAICIAITISLFIPVFSSSEAVSSLFQRALSGLVAANPIPGPPVVLIGGVQLKPYLVSGYNIFRAFEYAGIPIPNLYPKLLLIGLFPAVTVWFFVKLPQSANSKGAKLDLTLTYILIMTTLFLLLFGTTDFVWNFWPVPILLALGILRNSRLFVLLAVVQSYLMILGLDFIEHLSLYATGYDIELYNSLGLQLNYYEWNIIVSVALSIVLLIDLVIVASDFGKPSVTQFQASENEYLVKRE